MGQVMDLKCAVDGAERILSKREVSDAIGIAPHPPRHEHARHRQRQNAHLPSPTLEELAHDSRSIWFNGFLRFRNSWLDEQ